MNAARILAALMGAQVVEMGEFGSLGDLMEAVKAHHQKRATPEQYRQELIQEIERTMKVQKAAMAIASRENTPERELAGLEACLCGDNLVTIATYRNPATNEHTVEVAYPDNTQADRTYNAPDCCSASKIVRQIHDKIDDEARDEAIKAAKAEMEDLLSKARSDAPAGT